MTTCIRCGKASDEGLRAGLCFSCASGEFDVGQSQICRIVEALGHKAADMSKTGGFTVDGLLKNAMADDLVEKVGRGIYRFKKRKKN